MNTYNIFSSNLPGFTKLIDNSKWTIGLVNYTDVLKEGNLNKRERHLLTDEVFILVSGKATLYIGTKMNPVVLEIGKAYSVTHGTWHAFLFQKMLKFLSLKILERVLKILNTIFLTNTSSSLYSNQRRILCLYQYFWLMMNHWLRKPQKFL